MNNVLEYGVDCLHELHGLLCFMDRQEFGPEGRTMEYSSIEQYDWPFV